MGIFNKIFKSYSEKEVKRVMPIVEKINGLEEEISKLTDEELEKNIRENTKMICLNLPNNPTGTTITKDQLQVWVDYALKIGAVIIYDAAYEAYISSENVPHSIYE